WHSRSPAIWSVGRLGHPSARPWANPWIDQSTGQCRFCRGGHKARPPNWRRVPAVLQEGGTPMTTKLGLAGIGHVALKVSDIERSLEFYRDRLGFAEMMRLHRDDGGLWLVYLRITDAQFLELFPDGQGGRAPHRDATAIDHFCLECDDLDVTAARLRDVGVELTVEP